MKLSATTTVTDAAAPTLAAATASAAAPASQGSDAEAPSAHAKADPSLLVLKGEAVQGGLVTAELRAPVSRVVFPGHRATVSDEGDLPIAFYLNAPPIEKMTVYFKDGSVLEHTFLVRQRSFATEAIDGLPEGMVKLDPKAKKAHDEAEARIEAVRMKSSKGACFKSDFAWPASGRVTSHYGQPRVLDGIDGGIHWGVDIAVPIGTPVKAPACGTVVFAEADVSLAGGTLVLDHGQGVTSTFIHLSSFTKKVGDEVAAGDILAKSGDTGRVTGANLDWRMSFFEIRLDPELLAPPVQVK